MSESGHARVILVVLLGLALLIPGAAAAQSQDDAQQPDRERQLLGQLDDALVHRNDATGEVGLIGASPNNAIERPAGLSATAPPEEAARAYLSKFGSLFGLRSQSRQLRAEETGEAGGGRSLVHFQQIHEEVPVLGGELNVQVNDVNELLVANGEILTDVSVGTDPRVGANEARRTALTKIAKDREVRAADLEAADPELWIYDPALLGAPGIQVPRLVWRTEVTPAEGIVDVRELVLVDAQRGNVALNFDQIDTAKNRLTYDSNNTSALPGTLVCDESNPCTNTGFDADVRAAHLYTGHTYDFYSTNHGRDSLNNAGMTLISTVDHCPVGTCPSPYRNAFWNGTQMVYGEAMTADDVVGHELTHGVTEFSSRLFYYYQSGAINESLSDVWGEFIDLTNGTGNDTAAARWKLGEDLPDGVFSAGGELRNMQNPGVFGDPDRMQSPNYHSDETDSGGVHINSGVNNKAAYLMTDGGTFNGKTVTGLGITKVAKIYYEVQTNLLTSASDYNDLYGALQQACTNLTGTSGITAANCQEVKDAVDATQMNQTPTAAPNPEAPVCPAGQTASNLFSDNLENAGSGNWVKQTGTGSNQWYYPQLADWTYATSGTTNFHGWNQSSTADYSIAKVSGVAVPAGKTTYLRFNHSYGFDDGSSAYDGGVLEYSTNNGSTWLNAGSLIVNNGYNGTISNSFGNPLGGRQAFVRESNGYISSRVNLSSLAGQSVRFRFRIGTDFSDSDYGWFIDDVRVYTCEGSGGGDTTPPKVTGHTPTGKQVSRKANVTATFSEAMDATTITKKSFKLVKKGTTTKIAATVNYNAADKKAVLNPDNRLKAGVAYTATVTTGVTDLAGNGLSAKEVWNFKTKSS